MRFRTITGCPEIADRIKPGDGIFSIGSCFAENIAVKLEDAGFRVESNPFGVLYNPASIAGALEDIHTGREYTSDDMVRNGDIWCSPLFHGSFTGVSQSEVLERMNRAAQQAQQALAEALVVLVSFGTPWVYTVSEKFAGEFPNLRAGSVAANCHRFPSGYYERKRLGIEEISECYKRLADGPLKGKTVIFTVSPVRYIKDGLYGSNLGKAVLHLAVEEICASTGAYYFPAYEAITDDLRDYRFYSQDMVHPSAEAVEYIWELFREHAMTADAAAQAEQVQKLTAATRHRVQNPGTGEHLKWLNAMQERTGELMQRFPAADLSRHEIYFEGELMKYGGRD